MQALQQTLDTVQKKEQVLVQQLHIQQVRREGQLFEFSSYREVLLALFTFETRYPFKIGLAQKFYFITNCFAIPRVSRLS